MNALDRVLAATSFSEPATHAVRSRGQRDDHLANAVLSCPRWQARDRAQDAHGPAREKPREYQRDAKRQDKRPRRRCRHHDDRTLRLLDGRLLRRRRGVLGSGYRPIT